MNKLASVAVVGAVIFLVSNPVAALDLNSFCKGKESGKSYQNPSDCSTYVFCMATGKARVLNCPLGMNFKQDDKELYGGHCDEPAVVTCKAAPAPGK